MRPSAAARNGAARAWPVGYVLLAAVTLMMCCVGAWAGLKEFVLPAEPIDRRVAAPGPGCGDGSVAGADGGYKDHWDQYGYGIATVDCSRDRTTLHGKPGSNVYAVQSNVDNKRLPDVRDDGFGTVAVQITTAVRDGGDGASGGLVLGAHPPGSRSFDPGYDTVYFSVLKSGRWRVVTSDRFSAPHTERASGDAGGDGRSHTLRMQIEARNSTLTFFVDGVQVARWEHPVIDRYSLGLGVQCAPDDPEFRSSACAVMVQDYRYQVH
jgi:hypothetical protein